MHIETVQLTSKIVLRLDPVSGVRMVLELDSAIAQGVSLVSKVVTSADLKSRV
jgi:hypothetical protein